MRELELLSPARTADIGIEAIRHGADAVYIGSTAYGARQAAANPVEDIARLVNFARPFGVRIYVTINTLLKDDERYAVQQLIWELYDIGVSAIIIQDPCILTMNLPPIEIHASTQMDNRTTERINELSRAGFSQIVLARELNIGQIAAIHTSNPDVRLEAFVHGALCVSLSGCCYASKELYGRSANRGECAQVCRLKYNLETENGETLIRGRHLLSLRDMNRSMHLAELITAGVSSFKIEGRLKDMAYVKNVTAYYRQLLDNIISANPDKYRRSSKGRETYYFTPDPSRSFNRGFTSYLSTDNIFQPFTPKAMGEQIGRVASVGREHIKITTSANLSSGDGLCYFDQNNDLQGFRVNRADNDIIFPRPMPSQLRVGTTLYRNQDIQFDRLLNGRSAERHIPLTITLRDEPEGFCLETDDVHLHFEHRHEKANTPQKDNITKQLSRLGNTPYTAERVDIRLSENWFIPSSILASWRRELVEKLMTAVCTTTPPSTNRQKHLSTVGTQLKEVKDECPDSDHTLMTCRHCLRRELNACLCGKKTTQETATGLKPTRPITPYDKLYLSLPDGNRLKLMFDCTNCQMIITLP